MLHLPPGFPLVLLFQGEVEYRLYRLHVAVERLELPLSGLQRLLLPRLDHGEEVRQDLHMEIERERGDTRTVKNQPFSNWQSYKEGRRGRKDKVTGSQTRWEREGGGRNKETQGQGYRKAILQQLHY